MTVSPQATLLSNPISVTVRGLRGGSIVTIKARAVDLSHTTWTSAATFRVPSNGVLTLSQPARSGSYTGVDPMGLLLSMTSESLARSGPQFISPVSGYTVQLTATESGHVVASARTQRESGDPSDPVRDTRFRPSKTGIYGDLLMPTRIAGRRPGVVIFGGSVGGESTGLFDGRQLAALGYPVLALAFFGEPGLPRQLKNIPLEYFDRAISILRAQPHVAPKHVLVDGGSRGGELALLLGATYPSLVNGVIAGSPSSNVNPAVGGTGSAWKLHGSPVPQGPIAVEKINGPILLSCGGQDEVWDSCLYMSQITARLKAHHFGFPVAAVRFPDAGHLAPQFACCLSLVNDEDEGGTSDGNALAQLKSHQALVRFLAAQH